MPSRADTDEPDQSLHAMAKAEGCRDIIKREFYSAV
jgi:hypothetical protein